MSPPRNLLTRADFCGHWTDERLRSQLARHRERRAEMMQDLMDLEEEILLILSEQRLRAEAAARGAEDSEANPMTGGLGDNAYPVFNIRPNSKDPQL